MRLLKPFTAFTLVLLLLAGVLQTSAFAAGYTTLKVGDSGTEVRNMQTALITLNHLSGIADGQFGEKTHMAVRSFQGGNKLKVDGLAGNQTLTALYRLAGTGSNSNTTASNSNTTASPNGTLVYGNSGSAVKNMQVALTGLGYGTGGTDGQFGKLTLNAVKAFQRANRLTADGKAGASTLAKLYALAENGSNPPAAFKTLRSGASGETVRALQRQLASLDYKAGATGKYDSQTIQAVKSFQSRNKLAVDGVAGIRTQTLLFSGKAVEYSAEAATYAAPSAGQVKLMHWFDEVKPALRGKSSIYVRDPASGNGFTLRLYSLGNHADAEPMTAKDTADMMAAFGGKATWTPKFVYVRLPSGGWTAAAMHNVAHGGQSIRDNDFNGHLCVHFLRDMDEVSKNNPGYGVTNQTALRKGWQNLTGNIVE